MKRYNRMDRVSELVRREISIILDMDMRDKRIDMVTVTGADVSRDLRNARIYVSKLGGDDEIAATVDALNDAASYIHMLLGQRVVLKYTPELTFVYDSSLEYGMRMEKLFGDINNAQ